MVPVMLDIAPAVSIAENEYPSDEGERRGVQGRRRQLVDANTTRL
jgi:hypothetical protein